MIQNIKIENWSVWVSSSTQTVDFRIVWPVFIYGIVDDVRSIRIIITIITFFRFFLSNAFTFFNTNTSTHRYELYELFRWLIWVSECACVCVSVSVDYIVAVLIVVVVVAFIDNNFAVGFCSFASFLTSMLRPMSALICENAHNANQHIRVDVIILQKPNDQFRCQVIGTEYN